MRRRMRRNHSPCFKAKVALPALTSEQSPASPAVPQLTNISGPEIMNDTHSATSNSKQPAPSGYRVVYAKLGKLRRLMSSQH